MSKAGSILDKILGNSEEDLKKLNIGLTELRDLHEKLSAKYSLRSDLVELTDQRRTVAKEFSAEKEKFSQAIAESNVVKNQLLAQLAKFEEFDNQISEIKESLDATDDDGDTYYQKLLSITNSENIESISALIGKIKSEYQSLFEVDGNNENIIDRIKQVDSEFQDMYHEIFVKEINGHDGEKTTKSSLSYAQFNQLNDFYTKVFVGDEFFGGVSLQEQTDTWRNELDKFYTKIFGNEKQPSLELELETRLAALKEVEIEAKKVIDLSSDAGLAGGFVEKGKQARTNKFIALCVFILALVLLALFNFITIDFTKLNQITIQSIVIRFLINLPLLWLATVANINLNKYARLEEEYAHKESLAKSYERYKSEVEKLDDLEQVDNLKAELISINLEAFRKNPAKTMHKAKSNLPFFGERSVQVKANDQDKKKVDDKKKPDSED